MTLLSHAYHENFSRGTLDFPFDYHFIDKSHPRFVMPFHYHQDFEILYLKKGALSISLNERHYELSAGQYMFIGQGVVHGGQPHDESCVYECIIFNLERLFDINRPDFAWLNQIVRQQITIQEFFTQEHSSIIKTLADFFSEITCQEHSQALAYGKLLILMGLILKEHAYTSVAHNMATRYQRYLNKSSDLFRYIYDNYPNDIRLEDLAAKIDFNPKYFCKFFKELTGMRPMDYLNRFRIDCACIKLQSSTDSINQIAYACGFKDPCYFAKLFKRYKNISPRDFREQSMET